MTAPMRLPILDPRLALRGVDPRFAQVTSLAEDPAGAVMASSMPNDSILFPRQPSTGILTPEDHAAIKRNTILQVAASLLQAGGRSPNQRGTLANIGSALAGIDLPGAAQSALRMRAAVDELNVRAQGREALKDIARRHPLMPGATAEDRYNNLVEMVTEAATIPGLEDWVGKMSNVLAQTKPPHAERGALRFAVPPGSPPGTPAKLYRFYSDGSYEDVGLEQQITPYQMQQLGYQAQTAARPTQGELDAANWAPGVVQGFTTIRDISRENPDALLEAIPFLQTLDVATDAPGLGKLFSSITRAGAQQGLSKDAQKAAIAFIRWTASRVFAAGGKQLTQNEIRAAVSQYLPSLNEDPEVSQQRLTSMAQDAMTVLMSTGRAYPRFRKNLIAAGAPDLGDFDPYTQQFTAGLTFEDLLNPTGQPSPRQPEGPNPAKFYRRRGN